MRPLFLFAVIGFVSTVMVSGQPATLSVEQLLRDRLGVSAANVSRLSAGDPIVWTVPATTGNEIAAGGALRAKGDVRRLVAWLRDIEDFRRAAGTTNVGAIAQPATAADFARVNFDDVDVTELAQCRPGNCAFRMPAAYIARFQKAVNWKAADAKARAADVTRTLLAEYAAAYQQGGDAAVGAFHDRSSAKQFAGQFQDMLRRSTQVWDLAYPFASYLETFPKASPAGAESRFYWTRDKLGRAPTLTLHHVVIEQLAGGRVLLADKQFYASRQLDAALMIALAVPNADYTAFDLVVSVKARADAVTGVTGRVLRGRIEKEMTEGLRIYLDWIRKSMTL